MAPQSKGNLVTRKKRASRIPIDENNAMLLECIEDSGATMDLQSMAARRGLTKDAMRMKYNRLRARIYAFTTVESDIDLENDITPRDDKDSHEEDEVCGEESNQEPKDKEADSKTTKDDAKKKNRN